MALDLEKDLKFAMDVASEGLKPQVTVRWWQEGYLSSERKVNTR